VLIVRESVNAALRSPSLMTLSSFIIWANCRSIWRAHSGRARFCSNSEIPSVSQRGTRWFDI